MFVIADRPALLLVEQLLQARLALAQRQLAQIHVLGKQQVESEEDQLLGLAVRYSGLQRREIRIAVLIERDDLAVDQDIRQRVALLRDRLELVGPVQPLAGLERRLAVLDAQL